MIWHLIRHESNLYSVFFLSVSKKLPCSDVEIKLAKKSNPAATINNLIKYCFKDVDLTEMSYENLKVKNPSLLVDIYDTFHFFD